MIFHPIEKIQTSKSSWIITTAIDFSPYHRAFVQTRDYVFIIKHKLSRLLANFHNENSRYLHLIDLTLGDLNSTTFELRDMYSDSSNLIGHIHNRNKRSLLPLGGLLSFLFGTANQDDIDSIKQDVKTLYANQVDQSEVLNELVTITNVSRGLINDNRNIINTLVGTILNLNDTIVSISDQLMPLFTARRFQLLHTEFLIHHNRIKDLIKQMKADLDLIRSYLETHITGKLT